MQERREALSPSQPHFITVHTRLEEQERLRSGFVVLDGLNCLLMDEKLTLGEWQSEQNALCSNKSLHLAPQGEHESSRKADNRLGEQYCKRKKDNLEFSLQPRGLSVKFEAQQEEHESSGKADNILGEQ